MTRVCLQRHEPVLPRFLLCARFNSGDPENAMGVDPGSLPPSKVQIAFVVNPITGPWILVGLVSGLI